jgi:hypothetical protein
VNFNHHKMPQNITIITTRHTIAQSGEFLASLRRCGGGDAASGTPPGSAFRVPPH